LIASALNWARPLLAWAPVQKLLRRLADRTTGPSEEEIRTGRSRLEQGQQRGRRPPCGAAGDREWLSR